VRNAWGRECSFVPCSAPSRLRHASASAGYRHFFGRCRKRELRTEDIVRVNQTRARRGCFCGCVGLAALKNGMWNYRRVRLQQASAKKNAYSPYSHFPRRAALLCRIIKGASIDNVSYGGPRRIYSLSDFLSDVSRTAAVRHSVLSY
jgi:hypothetical protein